MSASSNPTLHPTFFSANARLVAKVDLPTPPFALEIAIVNLVPNIGFFLKTLGSNLFFDVAFISGFLSGIFSILTCFLF